MKCTRIVAAKLPRNGQEWLDDNQLTLAAGASCPSRPSPGLNLMQCQDPAKEDLKCLAARFLMVRQTSTVASNYVRSLVYRSDIDRWDDIDLLKAAPGAPPA